MIGPERGRYREKVARLVADAERDREAERVAVIFYGASLLVVSVLLLVVLLGRNHHTTASPDDALTTSWRSP